MRFTICLCLIFCAFICSSTAQQDCIQKVSELDRDPLRTDTLVEINPNTYKETTFYVDVYIDIDSDDALGIDKRMKKEDQTIYYIEKKDCYMIQRIEIPAKAR